MSMPDNRFAVIDSIKTRYWKAGSKGSPVLFLHGIGAFSETWLLNFNVFARSHRVFALDLPGHGLTEPHSGGYTIEYFSQFIDTFIASQHIRRVSLIGNSFGGGVALHYAHTYPDNVDNIVLVANPGFGPGLSLPLRLVGMPVIGKLLIRSSKSETRRQRRSVGILNGLMHDMEHLDVTTKHILLDMYCRMGSIPRGAWSVQDILQRYTNLHGIRQSLMIDFNRIVREVEAPALIIWGENDRVIPPQNGPLGLQYMRHARLHIIRECGHMPQLEHPDEFNRVVLKFLAN
jgi:4,5:9,10-diseco-3-hydroxy-5,9,17-trioxoandrosta-1(10),2-diene-4-oate hydrolase